MGCFHLWAIVNNATMDTGVCVSVPVFKSFVYIPRRSTSAVLGSY